MLTSNKPAIYFILAVIAVSFLSVHSLAQPQNEPTSIYSSHKDPAGEIETAIARSAESCKTIILIFGADWCPWCNRLAKIFDENRTISRYLEDNFLLVKIDVGKWDKNLDLAEKYSVSRKAGVPSLVFLNCKGKLIKFQETSVLEQGKGYSEQKIMDLLGKMKSSETLK